MTSQSKFKLIMMILVALLVLGGGGLVASYFFFPGLLGGNVNTTNGSTNTNLVVNATNQIVNNTPDGLNTNIVVVNTNNTNASGEAIPDENRILALGRSFTERYGSFSNQNEFENLSRLLTYMTSRLRQDTQAFITEQEQKQSPTDVYYGVTTDVVSINIETFEDKRAVVMVAARRRESREGENTVVSSQTARLVMVKQQGEWLVDKFEWQ